MLPVQCLFLERFPFFHSWKQKRTCGFVIVPCVHLTCWWLGVGYHIISFFCTRSPQWLATYIKRKNKRKRLKNTFSLWTGLLLFWKHVSSGFSGDFWRVGAGRIMHITVTSCLCLLMFAISSFPPSWMQNSSPSLGKTASIPDSTGTVCSSGCLFPIAQ